MNGGLTFDYCFRMDVDRGICIHTISTFMCHRTVVNDIVQSWICLPFEMVLSHVFGNTAKVSAMLSSISLDLVLNR